MDRQPLNKFRLRLLTGAILAFGALLTACDKPQAEKTAKAAAQADTAQAENGTPVSGEMPNITAEDIGNLARAMHGAASQQPDDAPKDKYGRPYIIGNLGGVPVNLPSSVVQFVEYDDSPGWDPEELRNCNPPTRSYQSILESFGLSFRNHDRLLYDDKNDAVRKQFDMDRKKDDDDWIRISVKAGKRYGGNKHWLDNLLQDNLRPDSNWPSPYKREEGENYFGLEVYVNYGIEPKTGRPWREHWRAEDVFVARDQEGNVQTYIQCSNRNVPSPPCTHDFYFPSSMKIRVYLTYNRNVLSKWRQIQDNAIYILSKTLAQLLNSYLSARFQKENTMANRQPLTTNDMSYFSDLLSNGKTDQFFDELANMGYKSSQWTKDEYNPGTPYGAATSRYFKGQTGQGFDNKKRNTLYNDIAEETLRAFRRKVEESGGQTTTDLDYEDSSNIRGNAYEKHGLKGVKGVFDDPYRIKAELEGKKAADDWYNKNRDAMPAPHAYDKDYEEYRKNIEDHDSFVEHYDKNMTREQYNNFRSGFVTRGIIDDMYDYMNGIPSIKKPFYTVEEAERMRDLINQGKNMQNYGPQALSKTLQDYYGNNLVGNAKENVCKVILDYSRN